MPIVPGTGIRDTHSVAPLRLVVSLAFALLVGCSSRTGPPLTPVSGKVTLNDAPVAGASVRFIPEGETLGHGGFALTREDGRYDANAVRGGGTGLLPGTYKVVFSLVLLPDGRPLPPDVPQQGSDAKETIPELYTKRDWTPFTVTIEKDAKTLDFALKK